MCPLLTAGVLVVVGLLGDGVHKLCTVRDDTAVIGETFPARVIGDGVVVAVLRGLAGAGTEARRPHQQRYSPHPVCF